MYRNPRYLLTRNIHFDSIVDDVQLHKVNDDIEEFHSIDVIGQKV